MGKAQTIVLCVIHNEEVSMASVEPSLAYFIAEALLASSSLLKSRSADAYYVPITETAVDLGGDFLALVRHYMVLWSAKRCVKHRG